MSLSESRKTDEGRKKRDSKRRKKNEVVQAPPVTQAEDRFMKLEKQLLPGISNNVTLNFIAAKLRSVNFHNLSSASPTWAQAIQDRLVHDSRLRSHSAEPFLLINHTVPSYYGSESFVISLYSLRDKTCYPLPPIPGVESGIPWKCRFIALDGKIYLLGGTKEPPFGLARKEVYVLDWAGEKQWNECASMQEARVGFGCCAKDGKIYVFGGTSLRAAVRGSEVYDPRLNVWSRIRHSGCSQFNNGVAVMGEEIVVYGGFRHKKGNAEFADGLRAYHPITDKWRLLSSEFLNDFHPKAYYNERLFMAQEKLHSMSPTGIEVYDIETKTWTERHSCWFAAVPQRIECPFSVLAVDSELVAVVWAIGGTYLVRSRGFGSEGKEILWEQLPCTLCFKGWPPSIRLLEL